MNRSAHPAAPRVKTRQFYWEKLPAFAVSSTVWGELSSGGNGQVAVNLDMGDLVATFAMDNAPGATASTMQVTSPTRKQSVTTLLDITRANNIAIMLSRIKLDLPGIRRALLGMSDGLSVDDLKAIGKQLPMAEEINRIKDFGDTSTLAKADQYFGHIMSIPRLPERLECMLYRRKLDLDIEEIRPELNILRNACAELRGSAKFKHVLRAVLAIGNALNGSSFRGGARGFALDGLGKLKETKTVKGGAECPTLLHYLAKVLMRSDPGLVNFIDEMPHLEPAARVSAQTIMQSVNQLVSGLNQVRDEIGLARAGQRDPDDRFVAVMQVCVRDVGSRGHHAKRRC
ncbi:Formin, FH2 domain-containing protein [Schizophyllum fasciatum]